MAEADNKPVEGAAVIDDINVVQKPVEMKFKAPMKKLIEQAKKEGKPEPVQRPSFTVNLPQYTWEGLRALLDSDSKVRDLILGLANDTIFEEARAQVMADENPANSDAELDKAKLNLVAIANLSSEDRAGRLEISKEELAAFADAFEKYLPALANVGENVAKLLAIACKRRLVDQRQRPDVLEKIRTLLLVFGQQAPAEVVEPLVPVLDYLFALADKFIKKPDTDKLAAALLS